MSASKAIEVISGINEFGNFVQLVKSVFSYLRTQWKGTQQQQIQDDVLQLQSDLQLLNETLPAMYNLIDRAEWRSHVHCVAELLPALKDAVYDAEDILHEVKWYELKLSVEGNAAEVSPLINFIQSVTQGSFNKVIDIQRRLSNISSQMDKLGLHEARPRFDKSVRPVTTSFPTEPKIFGRENEIAKVITLLGVPSYSTRSSKRKKTSNVVPVLPIVGMGGVGKSTLAQEITTHPNVKSHFRNKIIWICVSDDFDEEKFTKILIKSLSGKEATSANFNDLQQDLADEVREKRFLLIFDDIWPDALREDGRYWRKFCAPLKNAHHESMMLVTTRFAEVATIVGTMEPFALEGLEPEVFWEFFKLCVFGSGDAHIDPQLELIGRSILPKLKGNPLAANTIGRLLRKNLNTEHWNDILNSELWQIRQKETDILPALRLSYMYLPFHLKRCFSFCAVYPKDYNFEKVSLVEMWVAEGFVEPQGNIPLQHIGYQYFEDLVNLSFFQKLRTTYVIHDLMHDMAQLVSKDECFIIKNTNDIKKVPPNVRHLSILASTDMTRSNLLSLCKHTKLRTLHCNKYLKSKTLFSVMDHWFCELGYLRVLFCDSMREIPDSIGKLRHLRYLEIFSPCRFRNLPSSFCCLYNLQTFYARKCEFKSLPLGFSKMINLYKFEAQLPLMVQKMEVDGRWGNGVTLINKFNKITRDLTIQNLGSISKDHIAEMDLNKMEYLNSLSLQWSELRSLEHNGIEVLQALHPPTNLKSFHMKGYPGEYLPNWLHPCNSSTLTELSIQGCKNLSSLEQFLQPDLVLAIKKIVVAKCQRLVSLPIAKFGDLPLLQEFIISDCPNVSSQGLFSSSLKELELKNVGYLGDNIECCSLTHLHLSYSNLMSIQVERWSLPALKKLAIIGCNSLKFIGGNGILSSLTELSIERCENLSSLEQFLHPDCVPAIKTIVVQNCQRLSLRFQKFEELPGLEKMMVHNCPNIISRGLLSLYLKKLILIESKNLGDNLTSLQLEMWSLPSLQELKIVGFKSLAFIGKANIIHHSGSTSSIGTFSSLTDLTIQGCSNIRNIDVLLSHEYLPAMKEIHINCCAELHFLHGEKIGSLSSLSDLEIVDCPRLNWQGGIVLPSSLQRLSLCCCGDISSWFPSCLEHLTSLHSLKMVDCEHVVSIPGNLWMEKLLSLQKLEIMSCPDLVSIGGLEALRYISMVSIDNCAKLEEIDQPMEINCYRPRPLPGQAPSLSALLQYYAAMGKEGPATQNRLSS